MKIETIEEKKARLIREIKAYNRIKKDSSNSRNVRLEAEDLSFDKTEELRRLIGGDSDLLCRLLSGMGKTDWDKKYRPKHEEKLRKELES